MKRLMLASRMTAVAIAVVAAIDPAVTSTRRAKPDIALIIPAGADARDSAQAKAVSKALGRDFTILHGAFPAAGATVLVGGSLVSEATTSASPLFAVQRPSRGVAIDQVTAPLTASVNSRVPVAVTTMGMGDSVVITLSAGDLIIDRAVARSSTGGARTSTLTFVPPVTGTVRLRLAARSQSDSAFADIVLKVTDDRWSVLFFDRRPSWMSTFVRRSLENDRRFSVASRVMTSKGITADEGRPPSSLEDPSVLDLYDMIAVGAPEAMTARDAAALETFLRRRGGGVLLLFDEQPKGGAYDRLTGATRWAKSNGASVIRAHSMNDTASLAGAEMVWPTALPSGGSTLLCHSEDGRCAKSVVWSVPVGDGTLIVNGALDSWKLRDPALSGFDAFWRRAIADAAAAAVPAISLNAPMLARPAEKIEVRATLRDTIDAGGVTNVIGVLVHNGQAVDSIRLWPSGRPEELSGTVRVPSQPGEYSIRLTGKGVTAEQPLVIAADATLPIADESDMIAIATRSHGGDVLPMDRLNSALVAALPPTRRIERWYPMRSALWIFPFALLLGAEWWWRRREGLA